MSIAEKETIVSTNNLTIAKNEQKLYNAGYEKGKSAFGVIGKESGTVVRADNVNENEHIVKVGLSSKNKFPYPYYSGMSRTENGVTFTANADGSITLNGTPTATAGYHLYMNRGSQKLIEKGKTYTLSLFNNPASKNEVYIGHNTSSNGTTWDGGTGAGTIGVTSKTFTVAQDYKGIQLYIVVTKNAGSLENVTVYPQLEEGTTATPYTPYVADVTDANVTACGVNMFDLGYMAENYKEYGATYTDNSFTLTGTDDSSYLMVDTKQFIHANGNVVITLDMTELSNKKVMRLVVQPFDKEGNYLENTYPITGSGGSRYGGYLALYHGYFCDLVIDGKSECKFNIPDEVASFRLVFVINKTTYTVSNIQVEVGHTASDYESYNGTAHTPNTDGTLEIPSISPTMTLTTDKQGVNIECEYYLDGQAVIDELTNAIISLGGII